MAIWFDVITTVGQGTMAKHGQCQIIQPIGQSTSGCPQPGLCSLNTKNVERAAQTSFFSVPCLLECLGVVFCGSVEVWLRQWACILVILKPCCFVHFTVPRGFGCVMLCIVMSILLIVVVCNPFSKVECGACVLVQFIYSAPGPFFTLAPCPVSLAWASQCFGLLFRVFCLCSLIVLVQCKCGIFCRTKFGCYCPIRLRYWRAVCCVWILVCCVPFRHDALWAQMASGWFWPR